MDIDAEWLVLMVGQTVPVQQVVPRPTAEWDHVMTTLS